MVVAFDIGAEGTARAPQTEHSPIAGARLYVYVGGTVKLIVARGGRSIDEPQRPPRTPRNSGFFDDERRLVSYLARAPLPKARYNTARDIKKMTVGFPRGLGDLGGS